MTRFPLRVLRTIRGRGLLREGDRVLVALSGGPDSMALLEVLGLLAPRLAFVLVGVAHVHHGLRGGAADHDLEMCRAEAERRGLPFVSRHVDVAGEARRRHWSIERTAHTLRHAALQEAAATLGATRVALGHTRDDQAETVVLRFLRGAGTRGLGGMWPRRGTLVRPLIDVSRARVEQFLAERGLSSVEDLSNLDRSIARNRVRHEVLPLLTAVAGAGLPARLARQAETWRDEEAWLEAASAPWLARVLSRHAERWEVALDVLAEAPAALGRRVRLAVARELLGHKVSGRAVERLEHLERLGLGRRGRYGPWRVVREDGRLCFLPVPAAQDAVERPAETALESAVVFPVPGGANLTLLGCRIESEVHEAGARGRLGEPSLPAADSSLAEVVVLDAEAVGPELRVRTWQAGDRMRPRGLGGSQKLQDLFVNRKVPRARRARVPVVTTPDGRVVWVVGLAVDEKFAAGPVTSRVVILRATHPGGKA